MPQRILLVTPPFTQLNTPYPATAYIKGYLNTIGQPADQIDLGLDVLLNLFSKEGLSLLFDLPPDVIGQMSETSRRLFLLKDTYLETIGATIDFLQGHDPTLAQRICARRFLPEGTRFHNLEDLDYAFGTMGIRDQARHLATLYLEDISDFIVENVDPYFGFSRYAESLSLSALSFEPLYEALHDTSSIITDMMLSQLEYTIQQSQPTLICFTVPFPGNLYAALRCGKYIKTHYPKIKIALGGGYPNTELRSVQDVRLFEFVDYITLDDGETPLNNLIEHLNGQRDSHMLKRTLVMKDGSIQYINGSIHPDVKQENVGTPDYSGLSLRKYLSVISLTNPMHRLWSDGRWNKLTMAHGCYWGKCTFCDISLDYIKNYEASSATTIVNRMEKLVNETGERGFHFVDEAAPPALMKAVAIELIARKMTVTWWVNIRFEKSFSYDLCRLLAVSGCIAVSGGLEVASDRLLKLIAKGVTVEQVSQVNANFTKAGIMVHAYLMYGFPTQTDQETVDALEVVRQMFETGIMQSAFWHRFAMTAHSPVGLAPGDFGIIPATNKLQDFANNDIDHLDPSGCDHGLYSAGLKKSLYNYMHGYCIDFSLQKWFDHTIPETSLPPDLIANHISRNPNKNVRAQSRLVWIGGAHHYDKTTDTLHIESAQQSFTLKASRNIMHWLIKTLPLLKPDSEPYTYGHMKTDFEAAGHGDFILFWFGNLMEELKTIGLLVL